MPTDIRDARFYVVRESPNGSAGDAEPLDFEGAIQKASALVDKGVDIRVLYTEEASQVEITRFVSQGIPTSLVSGA